MAQESESKGKWTGVGLARVCEEDLLDVICGTHASCGYLRLCIHRVCFDGIVWGGGACGGEGEDT